ncbi:MAG: type 1 glutamine amidotransferase [Gammaproteobacteria bacterium]|nr:type 1 glutamine amidotransferase [Gammaproteobacteria bacterium]
MKPVLIFRHIACEGPGYLGDFLSLRNIAYDIISIDEGDKIPAKPDRAAGLVFMGGPMSVNDPLSWIGSELDLIRMAHAENLPLLGHCLGGQLISKALGGKVTRNYVPEIGWHPVSRIMNDESQSWLGELPGQCEVFHWHGETFTIPDGATPLLQSRFCANQAFAKGNTLALQCHVEMTANMVKEWISVYENDMPEPSTSVQSGKEMIADLDKRITSLQAIAYQLYSQWLKGLNSNH